MDVLTTEEAAMQTLVLTCPKCQAQLCPPPGFSGKRYRCAKCGSINAVETAAAQQETVSEGTPLSRQAMADPVSAQATPEIETPASAELAEPPLPSVIPSVVAAESQETPQGQSEASQLAPAPAKGALNGITGEKAKPRSSELVKFQDAMAAANKSALWPLRWAFLLTLVPLAWFTFSGQRRGLDPATVKEAFERRFDERLASKPEWMEKWSRFKGAAPSEERLLFLAEVFEDEDVKSGIEEVKDEFRDLEESRKQVMYAAVENSIMEHFSGLSPEAFLEEGTWGHWGLAAISATLFMLYFCFAYPRGDAKSGHLLSVGIFTGTIGILLLLLVQWLSGLATMVRFRGRGILTVIWLILIAIAFSYSAADNPEYGLILSCLGFTAGVGLLEELTKLLPIVWHYRNGGEMSWRGACVWGLTSGAGFGVAEGIMYSARYYNGSDTLGIYVVRFVSCVALHATWAGATAILMYRRREYLVGMMDWGDYVWALWPVLIIPMILHGLYDTLLKKDMAEWALVVAVLSFVFFVIVQEREARQEKSQAMALVGLKP